jgi:outer membrane protein OmpA-like peptidoglycan-associated protein
MALTKPLILATVSVFALAACDDPSNPDLQKTRNGAVIGAAIGVGTQILAGNSSSSALKAGVVGGVTGAVIGNVLDKQERDLRQDLEGSGATITNTGNELIVTLPEAITFDTDSTFVRGSLQDDLAALAQNLDQYPDSTVDVIGHTDSVGDASYNQNLSSRRAVSVENVLLNNGVSSNRIRAYGRGETESVASNDTADGRAANRRVEIVIRPTS